MGIICMGLVNMCFLAIVLNCSLGPCIYTVLQLAQPHGQGHRLHLCGLTPSRIHVNYDILLSTHLSHL